MFDLPVALALSQLRQPQIKLLDIRIVGHLLGRGVDHEGTIRPADAHRADRPEERHLRQGQCCRGAHEGAHVRRVLAVRREHRRDDLGLVVVAVLEERTDRAVDEPGDEHLAVREAPLALEEAAGDLARRRGLLDEVDDQREEVDAGTRLGVGGGDQHDGLAVGHEGGAVGLLGQATRLDGHLTTAELEVFKEAGVDVDEHAELSDPMIEYATEFAAILKTSLSTTQAAKRLGVHAVRIRQMIGDRTLYAVQVDGRWRIPEFQLQDEALVPNIGEVNAVIDRGLDAVSVLRWYTLPDAELETSDGEILSPLEWLKRGLKPEPVVLIASQL